MNKSGKTLGDDAPNFGDIPGWVYAVAFVSSIVVLIAQRVAKRLDKDNYRKFQRRAKLAFDTKLGMHSPV